VQSERLISTRLAACARGGARELRRNSFTTRGGARTRTQDPKPVATELVMVRGSIIDRIIVHHLSRRSAPQPRQAP
jgi:hypothetical protein